MQVIKISTYSNGNKRKNLVNVFGFIKHSLAHIATFGRKRASWKTEKRESARKTEKRESARKTEKREGARKTEKREDARKTEKRESAWKTEKRENAWKKEAGLKKKRIPGNTFDVH